MIQHLCEFISFSLFALLPKTIAVSLYYVNDYYHSTSCSTCPTVSNLGYRTPDQVSSMSDSDCRNTLIVELQNFCSDDSNAISSLSNNDLMTHSYLGQALLEYNIVTQSQISSMSLDDQRNTLIVQVSQQYPITFGVISQLQGYNTSQLLNVFVSYQSGLVSNENSIAELVSILGDFRDNNNVKFSLHDSKGNSMDALHIIQSMNSNINIGSNSGKNIYYGVYHTYNGSMFNIHLSQSTDLMNWDYITTLLTNADMPYLYYYYTNGNNVSGIIMLHEQWMNADSSKPSRLGFKLYNTEEDLLNGDYSQSFIASLTVGCDTNLEGTPNVYFVESFEDSTSSDGSSNYYYNIYVGFHYNDGVTGLDRNGFGILKYFGATDSSLLTWTTFDENVFNTQFSDYYPVTNGNIGQRAAFLYNNSKNYMIIEGNVGIGTAAWQDWKLWLWVSKHVNTSCNFDNQRFLTSTKMDGNFYLIDMLTPQNSTSFANPAVAIVDCPTNGQKVNNGETYQCIVGTYFVFSEGAGTGEAGSMLFYKEIVDNNNKFSHDPNNSRTSS